MRLAQLGSLFLTRPGLRHHVPTTDELRDRAEAVYELVLSGELEIMVNLQLPVSEASEAHRQLEGRATTGKVVLTP